MTFQPTLRWMVAALLAAPAVVSLLAAEAPPASVQPAAEADRSPHAPPASGKRGFVTETLRGKVVWLADALEQQFGVRTEVDAGRSAVVLATPRGRLVPIVPDTRGWAFTVDERLRDVDLELLVRRFEDSPYVQIIRVLKRRGDQLYEVGYWCDVCAIPMFISKPCECCQGATRLREEKLEVDPAAAASQR